MFLLAHNQPTRFGKLSGLLPVRVPDAVEMANAQLPALAGKLTDLPLAPDADVHESFDVLREGPGLNEWTPRPPRAHAQRRDLS